MGKEKKNRQGTLPGRPALADRLTSFPWVIPVFAAVAAILYGQALWFRLGKLDEYNIILVNLDLLTHLSNLPAVLLSNPFFNQGGDFYRPLQNLSFMVDAMLSGDAAWGYYLTGILLHTATVSLLFYLLTRIGNDRRTAFLLTLLFAVHPLFVQTVAWAPSRGDMLMTVFALAAFISFLEYIRTNKFVFLVINLISFSAALFSKEPGILVPAVCYLWYFLFEKERKIPLQKLLLPAVLYLIPVVLFFWLRNMVVHVNVATGQLGILALISHLRTIPELVFKFFVPAGLAPMAGYTLPLTIGGVLAILAVTALAFLVRPVTVKAWMFSSAWYLVFLGPSLLFVNQYGAAAFDYMEHRAYLPSVGVVIFLFLWIGGHERFRRSGVLSAGLVAAVIVFGVWTTVYARQYRDSVTFFDRAVRMNPKSAVAIYCRGTVMFYEREDYRAAIADFDEALRLYPGYGQAYLNRGFCREQTGDLAGAMADYRHAARAEPGAYEPHAAMALLLNREGMKDQARMEFDTALSLNPVFSEGFYQRAMILVEAGEFRQAVNDLDRVILLDPKNKEALVNRAVLRFRMQELPQALADLDQALSVDDRYPEALVNRGRVLYYLGRVREARADWARAAETGSTEARDLLKQTADN